MEPEIQTCQKDWKTVIFLHATSIYSIKRHKLTHNSSSQMLLIETKWLNQKENLLTKDVKKSLNLKEKFVKEMTNHSLSSIKRVLIQYV